MGAQTDSQDLDHPHVLARRLRRGLGVPVREFARFFMVDVRSVARWEAGECEPQPLVVALIVAVDASCGGRYGRPAPSRAPPAPF